MMYKTNLIESIDNSYESQKIGKALLIHADCMEWLASIAENGIDAVVTDPPYGVKEYDVVEIEKMTSGGAGIWRLPPKLDGAVRAPLPRFTALDAKDRKRASEFFHEWGKLMYQALKPGAHMFVASNSFMSQLVFGAIIDSGFEFRTEVIRLVQTLRGGDRPKLGEAEFPHVCSLPRGGYEPWGLFRKPLPKGMTVRECLKEYGTGGLRCKPEGNPFSDVIISERTPTSERKIANHPSLKPQSFLKQVVHASLPLGKGVVLDPFMGSGSTLAAAESLGYESIGVERYKTYYDIAIEAVPQLSNAGKKALKTSAVNRQTLLSLGDL